MRLIHAAHTLTSVHRANFCKHIGYRNEAKRNPARKRKKEQGEMKNK